MKILFMGTPDFARESLDKLYSYGHEICGVVTTPDRKSGRGMKMVSSCVKEYALEKDLVIFQPEKISKNEEFKEQIRKLNPDIICVVSYGVILPKSFLEIPKYGTINVHPSMLPKYRGPAPIQWAIINGDKTTGVTIMYLNEKMDAGDIITQKEVKIGKDETTGELWDRLAVLGAELLLETVNNIEDGKINRIPQKEEYTLAPMLNKEMCRIDWNKTGEEIKNLVRGLNPILGTYTFLNNKKIKLWKVNNISKDEFYELVQGFECLKFENAEEGTVLFSNSKKGLYIKCKDSIISVIEIQGENAKRMNIQDFLRGNKVLNGEKYL